MLCLCSLGAYAYDAHIQGIYYNFNEENKTAVVTHDLDKFSNREGCYSGNVVIPETVLYNECTYTVTEIGSEAFCNSIQLTSVSIPATVNFISDSFRYCDKLRDVTCLAVTPPEASDYSFWGSYSMTLHVPKASIEAYRAAEGWQDFGTIVAVDDDPDPTFKPSHCDAFVGGFYVNLDKTNNTATVVTSGEYEKYKGSIRIPETVDVDGEKYTVTEIGERAFLFCNEITDVLVPNTVTAIRVSAFQGCEAMTTITLGKSLNTIEDYAFLTCPALKRVNRIIDIPAYCLSDITNLGFGSYIMGNGYDIHLYSGYDTEITDLVIPSGVTTVRSNAFQYCSGLQTVVIGDDVESVMSGAFVYCTNLREITFGKSLTNLDNVGSTIFWECENLEHAIFHCPTIPYRCLENIQSVKEITIGEEVTAIGDEAFYCMEGLTSVVIPNSVTTIGKKAFIGCCNMTSIVLPASLEWIDNYAFEESNLKDVYCYKDEPLVNEWAFAFSNLSESTLHVPAASVEAYKATFPWSDFGNIVPLQDGDPAPTGIDAAPLDNEKMRNGENEIYDLAGQRLSKARRGVNIVNGKKYIKK
ncbi:MAG: leucine-rich repeat domain-containing protein [Bacteroidaceae bacterium]|nr:leucine-rich repeat domain-containing protein [Bacteroidaceae bacterium]